MTRRQAFVNETYSQQCRGSRPTAGEVWACWEAEALEAYTLLLARLTPQPPLDI